MRYVFQEKELVKINEKIKTIESMNIEALLKETEDKELTNLFQENKKLIYRIGIMKRVRFITEYFLIKKRY